MGRVIKNYELRITNWGKIFVFLWLLFVPTQLGKHFWPEWSHVAGLRVDYLSPVLYFGDILWMLMVLNHPLPLFEKRGVKKIFNFENLIVFLFILVNIIVAESRGVAIYKWVRILQWWVTFKLILKNKELFKEMLKKVLPWWIIGQGLLAVAQVINGGSLNGVFYWLGERRFSYISLGVAQISYLGEGLIRAYGTFSHPNSMAGFLLVALILFIKNNQDTITKYSKQLPITKFQETNKENFFNEVLCWIVVFCGLLGIFLAGSRTIWAIGIALIIINYQLRIKNWKKGLGILLIGGGLLMLVFSLISSSYRIADFVGGWDSDGLAKRGGLLIASVKMIKDSPLFGIGAGNFLVRLPEYQRSSGAFWLQPVHNIVFLLVSEIGVLGFILMVKILNPNFQFLIKKKNYLIILGIILVTGMVDHYWLTLPQNSWLLCLVLAIL